MYLLYLDESGSHGPLNNLSYVLSGLAIHADDAPRLQAALTAVLDDLLPRGLDPIEFELHAAEIRKPQRDPGSPWQRVEDGHLRFKVLESAFEALRKFEPADAARPWFVVAALAAPDDPERERRTYEAVLNRFDDALERLGERGLAISDVSDRQEELQTLAGGWRRLQGELGRLDHLVDVPFFSDSRASRLLQAADLVAWALWRRFGSEAADDRWLKGLHDRFRRPGSNTAEVIRVGEEDPERVQLAPSGR